MVSTLDWLPVVNCSDVNEAWSNFRTMFLTVLNSVSPEKTVRLKHRSEAWLTDVIIQNIVDRDAMLKDYKRTNDPEMFTLYKKLRNKVQKLVDQAKEMYYRDVFEENKNCSKTLWKNLNKLGASKNVQTKSSNIGLDIDGELSFDNNFFTTVANKLVDKLPVPNGVFGDSHVRNYYENKGVVKDSFKMCNVNIDCVTKALKM